MDNLPLSVIVPAYNCEAFIEDCIRSILSSKLEIEVVVIDDGSSDSTYSVVNRIDDDRLRIHRQDNRGVSSARNLGIDMTTGEFIMFVDADDRLLDEWSEIIAPLLGGNYDVVVFGDCVEERTYTKEELIRSIAGVNGLSTLKRMTSPCSKLYRRNFLKCGSCRFNSDVINGEDALFNLEVILNDPSMHFVQHGIYEYRIHSSSATHCYDERFLDSNEIYLKTLTELLEANGFDREFIGELIDASFVRSVKLVIARISREANRSIRRKALEDMKHGAFERRLSATRKPKILRLDDAIIYQLVKLGFGQIVVNLSRMVAIQKKDISYGWLTI